MNRISHLRLGTRIKERRAAYVAFFTRVDELLAAGRREEVSRLLKTETLPIDALAASAAAASVAG